MAEYLLDTSICVALLRNRAGRMAQRLVQHDVTDVAVSAITVAELEFGVAKSRHADLSAQRLEQFLTPLQILAFNDDAAAAYGPIRARLETDGRTIGPLDMLIAAQALALDMTLVTSNRREFERIDHLKIQDWT